MVRRLVPVVAAMALIASLSISSVSAAASPKAVLRSAFQAYWTGQNAVGYASFGHGAQAFFHAANTGTLLEEGAARIGLADPQEHCSSNLFGIWIVNADTKANLLSTTYDMSFGPAGGTLAPLAFETTAVKRVVDPQGFWGFGDDPVWWQSVGIPVYGSLEPGVYTFHVVIDSPDSGEVVFNPTITINAC